MVEQTPIALSWFEWFIICTIGAALLTIAGTLVLIVLRFIFGSMKALKEDTDKEKVARRETNQRLADTLERIMQQFQAHQIDELRASIKFIQRDEWIVEAADNKERARRMHERVDLILAAVNEIRAEYVTKADCTAQHDRWLEKMGGQ